MTDLTGASDLRKYVIDPIQSNVGKKLESYCYYDICKEDELTTNNHGIDVIAHQLELKFESNNPVFISWATIDCWFQYSLCVSEASFCNGVEQFVKQDHNWNNIVGTRLKRFQVYGYPKNVITSTDANTGKSSVKTYHLEPHFLILEFDGNNVLGIANFYLENDFELEPRLPMGDDVWIIFGFDLVNKFIKNLSLERLYG